MRRYVRAAVLATVIFSAVGVKTAQATNIVLNGGFETGSFADWTLSGNVGFGTGVCLSGSNFLGSICSSNSGSYAAVSGPGGSFGFVSQSLATTAGTSYDLTFYLRNDNLGLPPSNAFNVSWGGTVVYSLSNVAAQPFTEVTLLNLVASAPSTQLSFGFLNNPGGFFLDDVSVAAVPEPATWVLLGAGLAAVAARRRLTSRGV